jgi:hypothetical protein
VSAGASRASIFLVSDAFAVDLQSFKRGSRVLGVEEVSTL